jgi:hypothetical protein
VRAGYSTKEIEGVSRDRSLVFKEYCGGLGLLCCWMLKGVVGVLRKGVRGRIEGFSLREIDSWMFR